MLLTVLGCSGSTPGPLAPASGYLLEADGFALGIELGNGTLAELQAVRDPFTLGGLVFSHLHPDHCADFSALTVLRRWHPAPPADPYAHRLAVHAPKEAPTRFAAAYAADRAEFEDEVLTDIYDFHPLSPGVREIGPITMTTAEVNHPCDAYGFRFEHGGTSLAYTGDTGVCDALEDLAADVDVLLGEASWTHGDHHPPGVHLSGLELGALATRANARRLLITHVAPWTTPAEVLAEARETYKGPVQLAKKSTTYEI